MTCTLIANAYTGQLQMRIIYRERRHSLAVRDISDELPAINK